jgi:hypothetical protein
MVVSKRGRICEGRLRLDRRMRRVRFTPCDIHSGRLITKVGGLEADATKERNASLGFSPDFRVRGLEDLHSQ